MKEEIERRRAQAAEKRQKVEDSMDGEDKPFKCVSPRGSSLKVSPSPPTSKFQSSFNLPTDHLLSPMSLSFPFSHSTYCMSLMLMQFIMMSDLIS